MKQLLHHGPGIVIGIPTLGRPVPLDWALAFKGLNPPINYNSVYQIIHGNEVGVARQKIAEFAIEQDAKYLFFLGDDVVVPPHTLRQLIYRLEQDESIAVAGGVYCAKADPANPLVFKDFGLGCYWDWKIGEFFEVAGLGMDCTLIRVSVFQKLSKPWFKTVDKDKYLDNINMAEMWTEDLYFFNKLAEETDLKVYCDASVICEHWDVYGGKKYGLPPDSLPMRQLVFVEKTKKCLQIGAKIPLKDEEYEIVTFGNNNGDYRGHYSSLPFAEASFDRITITDMDINYHKFLEEWFRVLKAAGKLNILFKNYINLNVVLDHLTKDGYNAAQDGEFIEITKLA